MLPDWTNASSILFRFALLNIDVIKINSTLLLELPPTKGYKGIVKRLTMLYSLQCKAKWFETSQTPEGSFTHRFTQVKVPRKFGSSTTWIYFVIMCVKCKHAIPLVSYFPATSPLHLTELTFITIYGDNRNFSTSL